MILLGKERVGTTLERRPTLTTTRKDRAMAGSRFTSHHGSSQTRLYRIWSHLKGRCHQTNGDAYERYGGRGIAVCDEWADFLRFREWALANGYHDRLSIDRIDNDKDYSPDNCRWADRKEQSRNRPAFVMQITYGGKTACLAEHLEDAGTGLKYETVYRRFKILGWPIEMALHRPLRRKAQ
jgi:hypothetical protein